MKIKVEKKTNNKKVNKKQRKMKITNKYNKNKIKTVAFGTKMRYFKITPCRNFV